ncbi:MAG: ATP-binding cassette domain-containing protein [Rhodospirillales bacterium]|nr:MAG: ATP-binding cassette domain-containing protein [Rhodospirillales bacterium]
MAALAEEGRVERDGPPAIIAEGLTKRFGATRAVDGIDLSVRRGAIYGLLGPNGAGKTTTVRLLSTLIRPDRGRARVLGHDIVTEPAAVRAGIALTGQFASLDEDLTGRDNLVLIGRLLGLGGRPARSRADQLLAAFGLAEAARRQVRTYSGGMRRRLDIAASLVVTPDLIFLDEPTTGLDPRSRAQVWAIVQGLAGRGTTVLLTTQYLEEADRLAERIAVIDHGRVIAEGTSAELKARVGSGTLHLTLANHAERERAVALLAALGHQPRREVDRRGLSLPVADADVAPDLIARLIAAGIPVADFAYGQPTLDQVFFALTGHAAEPEGAATPGPGLEVMR